MFAVSALLFPVKSETDNDLFAYKVREIKIIVTIRLRSCLDLLAYYNRVRLSRAQVDCNHSECSLTVPAAESPCTDSHHLVVFRNEFASPYV